MMEITRDYNVFPDTRKRVTLRGAVCESYHVCEYPNGRILLEPGKVTDPESISAKTLSGMDRAMANYKKNCVSSPIDLSDFE